METCRCDWCGNLFWHDDPEWGMCLDCTERDSRAANTDRAVEQWLRYIQTKDSGTKAKAGR